MAQNAIKTDYDDIGYPLAATKTVALTFAGGAVKTSPGRLLRAVVTTLFAGTSGVLTFYDNATAASGTVLFLIPTAAAVGTVYAIDLPAVNGIFAGNASLSAGAVTIGYA